MKAKIIAAMLALAIASPVQARTLEQNANLKEIGFGVASVIDAVETCHIINTGRGHEGNFIIGQNASCGKVVAFKAVTGIAQYLLFRQLLKQSPRTADTLATVSLLVQGGVVGANLRLIF